MAGRIEKGYISTIEGPVDWYGHQTRAKINPATNSGAVTMALVIPWYLRGKMGNLQPETLVAYALFDDGSGVIIDRMDGEWTGKIDYDTETTGDVVNDKTTKQIGDVHNLANTTIDKNLTVGGSAAITGQASAKDFASPSVKSMNDHRHTSNDSGKPSSPPIN